MRTVDIRVVYRYTVYFVALICLTVGVVRIGGAIIDAVYADPDYYYTDYRRLMYGETETTPPPAKIIAAQERFETQQQASRNWAMPRLLSGLGLTLLAGTLYLIHSRALARDCAAREKTPWDAAPIYYYLVCLISLIVVTIALQSVLTHTGEVVWPYHVYSSGPLEIWNQQAAAHENGYGPAPSVTLVMDEVERARTQAINMLISRRLKSCCQSAVLLIVALIIHVLHYRRTNRGFASDPPIVL